MANKLEKKTRSGINDESDYNYLNGLQYNDGQYCSMILKLFPMKSEWDGMSERAREWERFHLRFAFNTQSHPIIYSLYLCEYLYTYRWCAIFPFSI